MELVHGSKNFGGFERERLRQARAVLRHSSSAVSRGVTPNLSATDKLTRAENSEGWGASWRSPTLAFPECLFARNSISRVAGFNFLETLLVLRLTSLLVGSGGNEGGRSHLGSTWRGLLKRRGERIDDRQTEETGDADTLHPRPESRFAA